MYPHIENINNDEIFISPIMTSKNNTDLMRMVLINDEQKVLQILEKYPEQLNAQNEKGWTALMIAANNSQIWNLDNMVSLLINADADVNIHSNFNETALTLALGFPTFGSSEATVKMLIDSGADVNHVECDRWTPLLKAVEYSTKNIVKLLIDAGANINYNRYGETILMHAVTKKDRSKSTKINDYNYFIVDVAKKHTQLEEIVKILIDAGVNVNQQGLTGWTALMLAVRNSTLNSSETTVKMLIDAGANMNIKNKDGCTALMFAARYSTYSSSEATVKMLIDAGADVNLQDSCGWKSCGWTSGGCTALMLAAKYSKLGSSEATVKMLIDAGADVDIQDKDGLTALMHSAQSSTNDSSETTVKMLIDAEANINLKDNKYGKTALMWAIRNLTYGSSEATVKMLLDAGADPTIKDNSGNDVVKKTAGLLKTIKLEKEIQALKNVNSQLKMQVGKLNLRPYPGREYLKMMQDECGELTKANAEEFAETNKQLIISAIKNGMIFE